MKTIKCIILPTLTLLIVLALQNSIASLIAYEPYNYVIGNTVGYASGTPTQTTGGGFGSGYNGNPGASQAVAGLTYAALGTAGNALNQTASYSGENLANPVSSGTVYISFLFNMSANPGGNRVGLEMNTGGNGMFVGFTAPYSATQGIWGVNQQTGYNDNSGNLFQYAAANITYGTTYFCVVKLTGTGSGWTGSIWINPAADTASETPSAPDGTFSVPQFTLSACSIVNPNGGNFEFDELRLGTTWAEAVDYVTAAPSAPAGLTATPAPNSVSLTWNAASGGPASYNVKRSTTSGSGYVTVSANGAVTGTNFTDAVVGGVTYYYVVSAVNAGGESANSAEVSASPALGIPAAPGNLTAIPGDGLVTLAWSSSVAASGYNVKRSTTSGAETTIVSVSGTNYTDPNVVDGTSYYYEVSATNNAGESANSSEAGALPAAYVPVYEPFNYATGAFTDGTAATGTGLSGNWTCGTPATIAAGLTYSGLTTADNALSSAGGRQYASFADSLARPGSTKWISFLFAASGNMGGNIDGVYFPNGGTGLFFGFGLAPNSGTQGGLGLGSIATTGSNPTGAANLASTNLGTYGATYLVVMEIQYNTGGGGDTVTVYLNPPPGVSAPGVPPVYNDTAFNVGTITGVGLNVQGGATITLDEFRTGATYASVVGGPNPTIPTTVAVSTNLVNEVSWTAYATNLYQPQSSPDNATWSNLGSPISGNSVTSLLDPTLAPYYQILEYTPVTQQAAVNGGFDTDAGTSPDTALNWSSLQSEPPVWINTDGNTAPGCMDLAVTNMTAVANGSELQQNLMNQGSSVTAGVAYNFSFWAKQISFGVSYVQQYKVTWLDVNSAIISDTGWNNFTGGTSIWTQIGNNGLVAPAGAVNALIQIVGSTGAVANDYGEVLIDDVSLSGTSYAGGPNILTPVVAPLTTLTAAVLTNGVKAGDATGSFTFKTNNLQLSVDAISGGVATSAGANLAPPYTVTAIYSGDGVYLGSTGTLSVGSSGTSNTPTNITYSVAGNQITLAWPADHLGWILQSQTNKLNIGLTTNWFDVTGTGSATQSVVNVDRTQPTVFFRLRHP